MVNPPYRFDPLNNPIAAKLEQRKYCHNGCDGFLLFEREGVHIQLDWSDDPVAGPTFESFLEVTTTDPDILANSLGIQWTLFMSNWANNPFAGFPACTLSTVDPQKWIDTATRIKDELTAYVTGGAGTGTTFTNSHTSVECGDDVHIP